MRKFIQEKAVDRVRQYALGAALAQAVRALIRPMYTVNRNIVFIIPEFGGYSFSDPSIKPLTSERIIQALGNGELDQEAGDTLLGFAANGCTGLYIEIEGELAGYAWIQFEGEYKFGQSGQMIIPAKHAIVRNLFVFSKFRGRGIGPKLNAARLAAIPPHFVPVVFIIPENRYAIRNWERFGFQRILHVTQSRWLSTFWRMRVGRLANDLRADELEQALKAAPCGNR